VRLGRLHGTPVAVKFLRVPQNLSSEQMASFLHSFYHEVRGVV
jgi:hypothetical protein